MKEILLICKLLLLCQGTVSTNTTIYTTPPSPNNELAIGYPGLKVTVEFVAFDASYSCAWRYDGEFNNTVWYSGSSGCKNYTNDYTEAIYCVESERNGETNVTSTLTFHQHLTTNLNISVSCNSGKLVAKLPYKVVQKCPTNVNSVDIISKNNAYNASGIFNCSNNGILFYSNKSLLSNTQTTCLASARWNAQDNLQCWRAPTDVNIKENVTVIAGTRINITCEYGEVTPSGNTNVFYFGNITKELPKNETLTLNIQIEDNNKEIYCQVVTPYTETYNNTGKSPIKLINVLYTPYQESSTICEWKVNNEEWCYVYFLSNPISEFVNLTKNGSAVGNDVTNAIWADSNRYSLFRFKKTNVVHTDDGQYTLVLWSSLFPNHHSIDFTIDVNQPTQQPSSLTQTILIVACSVLGFLLVVVVLVFISITCCCNKKSTRAQAYRDSMKSDGSFDMDVVQSNNKTLSKIKVERVGNPYSAHPSTTANATILANPNARQSGSDLRLRLNSTTLIDSQKMAESTDSLYITPNEFKDSRTPTKPKAKKPGSHFKLTLNPRKTKPSLKVAVSSESLYEVPDQSKGNENSYHPNEDENEEIYNNIECEEEEENIYENN